jgi:hypothetical protein
MQTIGIPKVTEVYEACPWILFNSDDWITQSLRFVLRLLPRVRVRRVIEVSIISRVVSKPAHSQPSRRDCRVPESER